MHRTCSTSRHCGHRVNNCVPLVFLKWLSSLFCYDSIKKSSRSDLLKTASAVAGTHASSSLSIFKSRIVFAMRFVRCFTRASHSKPSRTFWAEIARGQRRSFVHDVVAENQTTAWVNLNFDWVRRSKMKTWVNTRISISRSSPIVRDPVYNCHMLSRSRDFSVYRIIIQ